MITSNYHVRELLSFSDLSEKQKEEFSWVLDENRHTGFFLYQGFAYHTSQFMRTEVCVGWDGVHWDSYTTGVVAKMKDDGIVVGSYRS